MMPAMPLPLLVAAVVVDQQCDVSGYMRAVVVDVMVLRCPITACDIVHTHTHIVYSQSIRPCNILVLYCLAFFQRIEHVRPSN